MLSVPAPSSAHTNLVRSDPANGAALSAVPAEVTLVFNEAVRERLAAVTLAVDGEDLGTLPVQQGDARTVVATVPTARVPVGANSPEWTVSYRVTSDDGHPVEGTVRFSAPLQGSDAEPAAGAEPGSAGPSNSDERSKDIARTSPGSIPGPHGGGQSGTAFAFGLLAFCGLAIGAVLLLRDRRQRKQW